MIYASRTFAQSSYVGLFSYFQIILFVLFHRVDIVGVELSREVSGSRTSSVM